jgi:hypothetical protein
MLSFFVPALGLLLALLSGAALAFPLQPGMDGTLWRRHPDRQEHWAQMQ